LQFLLVLVLFFELSIVALLLLLFVILVRILVYILKQHVTLHVVNF